MHAFTVAWTPVFDDAIIATNAFDAITAHPRLVGIYTEASQQQVGSVYGLGPVLLWLLSLPTHMPGDWALPLTAGLVNAASILGVVALARRRGGKPFMFLTAGALAAMCGSLPSEALHDILNPSLALLPFTLLLFLAWSLACGEFRLLPLTVLVTSFVVQAHFSMGVASLAMLAIGVGGLSICTIRGRRRSPSRTRRELRRWLLASLAVALVCWAPPLVDQVVHRPGNLALIVETARTDEPRIGERLGWYHLERTIGIWPWWLKSPSAGPGRLFDTLSPPPAAGLVSCALILGGLTIVLLLGLAATTRGRRRCRGARSGAQRDGRNYDRLGAHEARALHREGNTLDVAGRHVRAG